ncbi:MAG TPA: hypothetical protein VGF72_10335, partial [Gaiellaceae bacterium]
MRLPCGPHLSLLGRLSLELSVGGPARLVFGSLTLTLALRLGSATCLFLGLRNTTRLQLRSLTLTLRLGSAT